MKKLLLMFFVTFISCLLFQTMNVFAEEVQNFKTEGQCMIKATQQIDIGIENLSVLLKGYTLIKAGTGGGAPYICALAYEGLRFTIDPSQYLFFAAGHLNDNSGMQAIGELLYNISLDNLESQFSLDYWHNLYGKSNQLFACGNIGYVFQGNAVGFQSQNVINMDGSWPSAAIGPYFRSGPFNVWLSFDPTPAKEGETFAIRTIFTIK